jgi:hypothetical protein
LEKDTLLAGRYQRAGEVTIADRGPPQWLWGTSLCLPSTRPQPTGSAKNSLGVRKHTLSIVSLSSPKSFMASMTRGTMK